MIVKTIDISDNILFHSKVIINVENINDSTKEDAVPRLQILLEI